MALILVVEQESRYIERIRDALTSEGWQVRTVDGAQEALSTAEREPPQLVLVSRESEGADRLFQAFSRRTGGPGVVALLPESAIRIEEPAADDALAKPFTDQDLRLAVRRGLKPQPQAAPSGPSSETPQTSGASDGDQQLTAQDIFGDVVAEVESEIRGSPEPRETPKPRRAGTDDMDLEKTLSGLRREVELGSRPESRSGPKSVRPDTTPAAPSPPKKPRKKKTDTDLDVDALLSETLSGLDLPSQSKKKSKKAAPPPQPAETQEETSVETPVPAETSQPAEPRTPSGTSEATGTSEPSETSLADLLSDDEDIPPPTQVQPPPDLGGPDPTAQTPSTGGPAAEPPMAQPPAPEVPSTGVSAGGSTEPESEPETGMGETEPEEIEISFAELSAPSLQEVPEPFGTETGTGTGTQTGTGPDLDPEVEDHEEKPSLGDWLESGEDSMFDPEASSTGASSPGADAGPAPGEDAAEPSAPSGRRFGQYTLLDRIAVGGMAEVWKARSTGIEGFQKTVAIKKILPHLTDNDDFVNMFIDEAKLAAQLSHPNIIHIYDLGKIGDHFYIAMEYVEGKNLRAVLNESRRKALPLPRGLALLVAARLASALDYAHRKKDFEDRELGLVHRDVSPQNVLLSDDGDIKLCDFGIVKAVSKASQTQMGALKGKLQYMSPEQAWGKDLDGRSDLFSLGAILFEMLTGRRLFAGDSEISVLEAVRQCRVIAPRELVPQIPEQVEAITLKALAMDPGDRFQTAGEMQQELEEVLYSVKPAPSPADLADFLHRLAEAREVDEGELVHTPEAAAAPPVEPSPTGTTTPAGTTPAEAASPQPPLTGAPAAQSEKAAQPPEKEEKEQPRAAPGPAPDEMRPGETPPGTAEPTETEPAAARAEATPAASAAESAGELSATAMPAMADYDLDELEGGRGGRRWLVALIVFLVVAGAAGLYYYYYIHPSGAPQQDAPETEAPAEPPSPPAPSPLDEVEPETPEDVEEGAPEDLQGSLESETRDDPEAAQAAPEAATSTVRPPPTAHATAPSPRPSEAETRSTTAETRRTTGAADSRSARDAPGPPKDTGALRDRTEPKAPSETPTRETATPTTSTPKVPPRSAPTTSTPTPSLRAEPAPATDAGRETRSTTSATVPPAGSSPSPTEEPAPDPASSASEGSFRLREDPAAAERAEEVEDPEPETPRRDEPVRLNLPAPAAEPEPETASPPEREAEPEAEPAPQPEPEPPVREGDLVGPGPGVSPPVLVRFDKPSYPPIARRMKVEGDVVLSLLVDENGRVVETRLIQGVREGVGLHQVALDAARRARYRPATKNGVRVKMWTTLKIPFRL